MTAALSGPRAFSGREPACGASGICPDAADSGPRRHDNPKISLSDRAMYMTSESMPAAPNVPQTATMGKYRCLLRRCLLLAALVAAIIACVLVDFTLGPSGLGLDVLLKTLLHPQLADGGMRVIVWDIRLPYVLMAVAVGLSLGLAGAEMQTILNNPLASPFTLGVSSAAAFGAALAIILGIGLPGLPETWFIAFNAFVFALLAALLLDAVTRWTRVATSGVVLFGIALVFTFNALVSMMQFIASEDMLQGLVFWTMGSLARASWPKLMIMSAAFALLLPWSLHSAWKLTALLGALVLSMALVASKNIVPGTLIPVGIVTSLVGVPFFLSIILRHRGNL